MQVKAILNEPLNYDYLFGEIGDEVYGVARSYGQDFITTKLYDDSNASEENEWEPTVRLIKIKVVKGSIKRLRCYYDDEYCSKEIVEVSTHHHFLCTACRKENDSMPEERLDTGYHAMDYLQDRC